MSRLLVVLEILLALGALGGGGLLLADPSGAMLGLPPGMLEGSAFDSFFWPALALFAGVGVFPVVVAAAAARGAGWARLGHVAVPVVLLAFLGVELAVIGPSWLLWLYAVYGVVLLGLSLAARLGAD